MPGHFAQTPEQNNAKAITADQAPFGVSAADRLPFGSQGATTRAGTTASDGQQQSSDAFAGPSEPQPPQQAVSAPAAPKQTMAEIRAGVLKMVTTMLEEQRAKVAILREQTDPDLSHGKASSASRPVGLTPAKTG